MKRVYFRMFGSYWSCSPETLDQLEELYYKGQSFDLYKLGCKELKRRPHGEMHSFGRIVRDNDGR